MKTDEVVWFVPFTRQLAALADAILALEKAGFALAAHRPGEALAGAGLLFLDASAPLPEVADTVAEVRRAPGSSVLAVSLSALPTATTWELLRQGVSDVIAWPGSEHPAETVAARLRHWHAREAAVAGLQRRLVGSSPRWLDTLRQVVDMAWSSCQLLITGESGTGKELIANEIHRLDQRPAKRDCVVVDCTNLIPGLSGSELFGHEKGAFTNAISTRDGAVALAHEGTLFLDELGELPLALQAELLRTLQEGTYKRVGSNTWRQARFRLVSATNRDLLAEVQQGTFRQDLYYRVSGWTCQLPPLRERRADIVPLARHFFAQLRGPRQVVEAQVYEFLLLRDYPGNVRELQQLVARIASRHPGESPITIGDIPQADWPDFARLNVARPTSNELEAGVTSLLHQGLGLKEIKDQVTEIAKQVAISHEHGNLKQAALRLRCSERILQMHRRDEPGGTLRLG